jgi:hypothetical protein
MDINPEVVQRIGQPESEQLEYKSVLPPAATVAQLICSFANANGGAIVLGVVENGKEVLINGLSDDFRAVPITRKAIDLLSPAPTVNYAYITYQRKRLFIIDIKKSDAPVALGGRAYIRVGGLTTLQQAGPEKAIRNADIARLSNILKQNRKSCTAARAKLLDHYESVLRILDDLGKSLYPESPTIPTNNAEGKMLLRILFSSCADTFEIFMSDLLYEIYLAKPETLKSNASVTVKDVLDCADIQEFISRHAKAKLKKLQRGSVKGFIADNKQIKSLGAFDSTRQEEIEKILQIRHLYAHQNGVIDERFREFFPAAKLNDEYQMTLDEFLKRFEYLAQAIDAVDGAARNDYQLAPFT